MKNLDFKIVTQLSSVDCDAWNSLLPDNNPFLRHEFLCGLETYDCINKELGWQPHHYVLEDESGKLLAAMPAYLKNNSFGEFVFDWPWASAYERNGLSYYPKLVAAVPFTPVTGPRLLIANQSKAAELKTKLLEAVTNHAAKQDLSSFHCLFPNSIDAHVMQNHKLIKRLNYQYHWVNENYRDFDHYLSRFQSRKRKKIKQERKRLKEFGVNTKILHGNELDAEQWKTVYQYYQSTFFNKGNYPALKLDFFHHLAKTIGDQLVVVLAEKNDEPIAAAINFRSDDRLYGRYWGCEAQLPYLHFEVCFYTGIEYCISHRLKVFEPGAQGEHKISRGFAATETYSLHWIKNENFRHAISDFLERERTMLQQHKIELDNMLPFHSEATK